MNCPRCNYPINKDNVWSNCPKCNCRLYRETAPTNHSRVSQLDIHNTNATRNVKSTNNHYAEGKNQPYKSAGQKQPKVAYCMNCGQKIEAGQKYCFRCGSAKFVPKNSTPHSEGHKNAINKKLLFPLCSGFLLMVLIIIVVLLLNYKSQESPLVQSPDSNAELVTSEETTIDVNFDLNEYNDHGNLSCGLIWVSKDNWNDKRDEYRTEFSYCDSNGNIKSPWFNYDDYYPRDFKNNFVIVTERYHDGIKYTSEANNLIYDTDFNLIGNVVTKHSYGTDYIHITDFNEYGYAIADGNAYADGKQYNYALFWIDKNGVHRFDDAFSTDCARDAASVDVTDKYFIPNNWCICDHQGHILVDMFDILKNDEKLNENYTVDEMSKQLGGDRYTTINIMEIVDDEYVSFEFNAKNKTSSNIVWFSCKIDFSGNIIDGPNKKNP